MMWEKYRKERWENRKLTRFGPWPIADDIGAGLPSFAPALTEAIFNLTGKRIRKLPFDMDSI